MSKLIDITGKRYGRLIVLRKDGKKYKKSHTMWLCRCDCGNEKSIDGTSLKNGKTASCGCLWRERSIAAGNAKKGKYTKEKNAKWNGGVWKTKAGYVVTYKPSHQNSRKTGYMFEHVYVMSNHLGRPLLKNETVHHKDGDKGNNKINNLELRLKNAHPPGQRVVDLVAYWKEMLKRYETIDETDVVESE